MILERKKMAKVNIYNSIFLIDLKHFNVIKRQTHFFYVVLASKTMDVNEKDERFSVVKADSYPKLKIPSNLLVFEKHGID